MFKLLCEPMKTKAMLFPRRKSLLTRSCAWVGCALLCAFVWVMPTHAESLEKAIEAYDFKEYQDAAQWLRPWAEKGQVEAQYLLGTLYENGQGIATNLEDAKKWYRTAAAQGHGRARHRLDALEGKPARDSGETVALKWYLDLAQQGDPDAQYNLGFMYETGFSVTKDNGKAAHWYEAAAEKKHVLAQMRLGLMYLAGAGVKQSEIQAAKWLSAASELSNKLAAGVNEQLLGTTGLELPLNKSVVADKLLGVSAKDEKAALALLSSTVQAARALQVSDLAKRDLQLAKGKGIKSAMEQDTHVEFGLDAQGRRTIKWYQSNAERGSASAQFQLAKYYELGIEVPVDMQEAVRWYRSAAEQGYPEAQFYFAMLNYYGIGVDHDEFVAQSLIQAAAQQGHAAAQQALDTTSAVIKPSSMAVWWLTRFGQEQNGLALQQVGNLYELGRGTPADISSAKKYYQAASAAGVKAASQSSVPSTQRVAASLVTPARVERAEIVPVPVQNNVISAGSAQALPGNQSHTKPIITQPWVNYLVVAGVALVPILIFLWVAVKERRRMLENKKKDYRPRALPKPNSFG